MDRPGRRSVGWPGHAVLQVPVIELEDWIVTRTRHYDAGFISDDPGFHHAHITHDHRFRNLTGYAWIIGVRLIDVGIFLEYRRQFFDGAWLKGKEFPA